MGTVVLIGCHWDKLIKYINVDNFLIAAGTVVMNYST